MAMPRKNSDNGGVEIKDMSEADLLLLSTVDQDIIVTNRIHWLHLHERKRSNWNIRHGFLRFYTDDFTVSHGDWRLQRPS